MTPVRSLSKFKDCVFKVTYLHDNVLKKILNFTSNGVKKILLTFITLYQKTFSPDHGLFRHFFFVAGCRFYPTCSQYGYEAINRYGVMRGLLKSTIRIAKCNPFHKGGIDPLP